MTKERINLIPMAGAGQRFVNEGFTLPKPLIPVDGMPMVLRACEALPEANRWIFVVRKEVLANSELARVLQTKYCGSDIIEIDYLTAGQASTCALANDLIPNDAELLIGPCDNGMFWNKSDYQTLVQNESVDAIIWTFRNYPPVREKANMYGWVKTSGSRAMAVSCKRAISNNPLSDHAVVGTFFFRRADLFKQAYNEMLISNRSINGEFYVDELMNLLIEDGRNVHVFEIHKYLCWGTPDDLRTYEYWRKFFLQQY